MRIKFTDKNLRTYYDGQIQQYILGEWVSPVDGLIPTKRGACGQGSIHVMKHMRPIYAPPFYLAHEVAGKGKLGEDSEKVRYKQIKLLQTLSDEEINLEMDKDWSRRIGRKGMFLPISWVRNVTYLDREVNKNTCEYLLQGVLSLINCKKPILFVHLRDSLRYSLRNSLRDSLGDSLKDSLGNSLRDSLRYSLRHSLGDSLGNSLGDSLKDSLGNSLWHSPEYSLWYSLRHSLGNSLWYERGFALARQPKQALSDLLEVWKLGACPLGETREAFIVLVK